VKIFYPEVGPIFLKMARCQTEFTTEFGTKIFILNKKGVGKIVFQVALFQSNGQKNVVQRLKSTVRAFKIELKK